MMEPLSSRHRRRLKKMVAKDLVAIKQLKRARYRKKSVQVNLPCAPPLLSISPYKKQSDEHLSTEEEDLYDSNEIGSHCDTSITTSCMHIVNKVDMNDDNDRSVEVPGSYSVGDENISNDDNHDDLNISGDENIGDHENTSEHNLHVSDENISNDEDISNHDNVNDDENVDHENISEHDIHLSLDLSDSENISNDEYNSAESSIVSSDNYHSDTTDYEDECNDQGKEMVKATDLLYKGAMMSEYEFFVAFMSVFIHHNLTYSCAADLLKLIKQVLPIPNFVPQTPHTLIEKLVNYKASTTTHRCCGYCTILLHNKSTCIKDECKLASVSDSTFIEVHLDKQIQNFFQVHR